VTFSVIPGGYNGLQLRTYGSASGAESATVTFNGDTTSGHYAYGGSYQTGTSGPAATQAGSASSCNGGAFVSGIGGQLIYDINFYSSTSFGKMMTVTGNAIGSISSTASNFYYNVGCAWNQTSAITSITITLSGGDYAAGTKFELLAQQ
jgi:hypothetical protein